MFQSLQSAIAVARRDGDLYFAALLDRECILEAFGSASSLWKGWLYTPAVTVWVFLSQCLSTDHSCRDAVSRFGGNKRCQEPYLDVRARFSYKYGMGRPHRAAEAGYVYHVPTAPTRG
jgi:hypothetical protein